MKILFLIAQLVFLTPPDNFKPVVEAAGCFIHVGDKILFVKRQPFIVEGGTWAVPGGKVEKGETPEQAVIREVWEETGVELSSVTYLEKTHIRNPKGDFIYSIFEARLDAIPEVILDLKEHSEYKWLTLEEALSYQLIPGEVECINLVYKNIK